MASPKLRAVGTLQITSKALCFNDPTASSNPLRRPFDWTRSFSLPVSREKPYADSIPAGGSLNFFNGTRSTTLDGTSAFGVTVSPLDPSRYRFTWTGGTNPVLRTDRGLALSTVAVTIAINLDSTAFFTVGTGTWGSVAAGDTVFIPGVSTGDPVGPFSVLNEGAWTVIAVLSSTRLQLARPSGVVFTGTSETQTVASNPQLVAFSAGGVQVADTAYITAGFAVSTQRAFSVVAVTSTWFEVISAVGVAQQSGITPGSAGLIFYTAGKRWIRIEVDQQAVLQLNGVTDSRMPLSPVVPGDTENVGYAEGTFTVWSLTVVNQSSQVLNARIFSVE